jgi:hypothetical protein
MLQGFTEVAWEIRESKSGQPTLLLGNRAVYSLYDPLQDAHTLAGQLAAEMLRQQCDHLIIIGWGLGYLPQALVAAGVYKLIVWEPFPVMQQSFPPIMGEWREQVQLVHTCEEFSTRAKTMAIAGAKPKIVVHPGYGLFSQFEYQYALRVLAALYRPVAERKYSISQRSLEAVARLPYLGTIRDWAQAGAGQALTVVNPGPSLKDSLVALQQTPQRIVMASVQAAPFLQKNGIKVNFMVCAEPVDMLPFLNECSRDIDAFFVETSVDPQTAAWLPDRTFQFHFRCGYLQEMLWEQEHLPVFEDPMATVAEAMILLADSLGFAEVYCVGLDGCWTEQRYTYRTQGHAYDGTITEAGKFFEVMATNGQPARTMHHYFHAARYLQWKSAELKKSGKKIYQMRGGLDIGAMDLLTPSTLAERLRLSSGHAPLVPRKAASPFTLQQVLRVLENAKMNTAENQRHTDTTGLNPNVELWPFLKEIPVPERAASIDACIDRLKSG